MRPKPKHGQAMDADEGVVDTRDVARRDDMPASRTRTLAEDEAAVGARWERSTGATIGRYVVDERLGAGAMGVVFRAHDPKLDRHVAIKMSHASHAQSRRGAERFAREARAMAALQHPNVVEVYDFGVRDGEAFLVMELLEATTLSAWLRSEPSRADRMRVLLEAGRGLAAAHEAGLVHRDFKPANVLITAGGTPKVTDFGLARVYGDEESNSGPSPRAPSLERSGSGASDTVTADGVVIGTPAYMSPEQHRAHPLTPQSDQYSFCLTAFEVLTGRRLFDAPSLVKLEILKEEGPPLDAFRELPLAVARALRRGLQPRAHDRFRDLHALLSAMQRRSLRSWVVLSAAFVLPVALLAIPTWHRESPACAEQPIVSWGQGERDDTRAVFDRSTAPDAIEVGARVIAILDGQASALAEATRLACALEAPERDLAQICLERQRTAFEQFTDRLVLRRSVPVEEAIAAASRLSEPAECLQPRAEQLEAARANPRTRAYLEEVERRKVRALDAFRVADRPAAVAELEASLEAISMIEPPVLRTKPLSEIGNLFDDAGEGERASQLLHQAYDFAAAADDDRAAATAAVRLIWIEGVTRGRSEDGRRWAREAEARMTLFVPRSDMAAARLVNLAAIAQREQDLERSLELMLEADRIGKIPEESVSAARQNVLLVARANRQYNIGTLYYLLGDSAEALSAFQRAVVATQEARGLEHPDVADVLEGVSRTAESLGDLDLARVSAKTMIRIREKHRGKEHPSVASAMRTLASVEYAVGDLDEVRRLLAGIVEVLDMKGEKEYEMEAAAARVELCTVLRELGRTTEAIEQATYAYEAYERETDPRYSEHRAGALRELALIHAELGRHEEAITFMARATEAAESSTFEALNRVVFAVSRVYVLDAAGRYDEAVQAAEAGMDIAEALPDAVDTMLLQLRFAEALGHRNLPGDLGRALTILDGVEVKAQRVGADMILASDLPDTRAELEPLATRR